MRVGQAQQERKTFVFLARPASSRTRSAEAALSRKPAAIILASKRIGKHHSWPGAAAMLLGYARVSKADGSQLLDPQLDALREAGIDGERVYEDRMSGRHDQRPGLDAGLKALRAGDTLCI